LARFRLRYRSTDLELPPGDFVIGRGTECSLAVDDPLVSRRHALLRVAGDTVTAEDLGSRNGILVNGERVKGARVLDHMDTLHVGAQELVLVEVGQRERDARRTGVMIACPSCALPVPPGESVCAHCGRPITLDATTHATLDVTQVGTPRLGPSSPAGARPAPSRPAQSRPAQPRHPESRHDAGRIDTAPASPFRLIAGIADKALAMGRPEDAERILSGQLHDLLQRAQSEPGRTPPSADEAVAYALRLAEVAGKARWIDWIFQFHTATGTLLGAETIDTLYDLVRKVRHPGGRALADYVHAMQAKSALFGPREKFLLQRLSGLERIIGA
jgi:predicted component of type VI protein secretion system